MQAADIYRADRIDTQALSSVIRAGMAQTAGLFKNITRTTAGTASNQFENALDRAWLQVSSGAFDANTAIRNTIKELSAQGIKAVSYPGGHTDTIETAVRRAIVTGVNQTALRTQEELADELECDLVETTAHEGARPEHAVWQGRVFSRSGKSDKYPDFRAVTGYGTGAGLGGWNCRHSFYPYVEGEPLTYSEKELAELEAQDYEYNGQKMTEYGASQKQRYIERNIRRWERENVAMEKAGFDTTESAAKIKSWQETQKDFLSQTGLKLQSEREQIAGFGRGEAARATAAAGYEEKFQNLLEKARKNGTISASEGLENYIAKKTYDSLHDLEGKLSNRAVRKWYVAHDEAIPALIDKTQPIEQQARQACELRNTYRTQARDLMCDQEARKVLDQKYPNRSFEQLLEDKMREKNMTREQAIQDIYSTATKTNKQVNAKLGV